MGSAPFLVCSLLFAYFLFWQFQSKQRRRSPPGPPSLPLLGNLHQLLTAHDPVSLFFSWSAKYGTLVFFSVCGRQNILVTSPSIARELLDKRGSVYADRPRMVHMNEVVGTGNSLVTMRYGSRFRKQRRMMQPLLTETAMLAYRPTLENSSADLLQSLLESPDRFPEHLNTYAALIYKLTYGLDYKSNPQIMEIAHEALTRITPAFKASGNLIDVFPILRYWPTWAPFSQWKRELLEIRECMERARGIPYEMAKKNMKSGDTQESLVFNAITAAGGLDQLSPEDDADIRGVASILYLAAQETTVALMGGYIFALVLFPQIQSAIHAELDAVIPDGGMPTFEDRTRLPYLEAVFKELYRWASPLVMSPPHVALEDDVYDGFLIRRGTAVTANVYAMFQQCPEPQAFRPERFIDGTDLGDVPADPRDLVFGFGRRRCPGIHVADRMLWLSIAHMAVRFEFLPSVNDEGKIRMPDSEFEMNMLGRKPRAFKCRIVPRGPA